MPRAVCFGEVMIRLSSPPGERLLQSAMLEARVGGAEANVAVSLARFGWNSRVVTRLPDQALGRAVCDELRRHGVDTSWIAWDMDRRLGLYFLTPGAVVRPSEVLYDRAASAFAEADPAGWDWDALLDGADRFHLSGVTPAVGPRATEAALAAVEVANRLDVPVSFDGNYRAKLWAAWNGDGPGTIRGLLAGAETAFVDDRDLALVLGRTFDGDVEARRRASAQAAFDAFPRLQRVLATVREQTGVDDQTLSALAYTRDGRELRTQALRLSAVVDRIGGGDAFAAGVLHVLGTTGDEADALAFGLAASALKHSVKGDFNTASESEVRALMDGGGLDVRR